MKSKKAQSTMAVLSVGIGIILLIILYGVFATLGSKITQDFRSDTGALCVSGSGATWNESAMGCWNGSQVNNTATTSYAWASTNTSAGLSTAGAQTPTIASVGGFVLIIALLAMVAIFAFRAFE